MYQEEIVVVKCSLVKRIKHRPVSRQYLLLFSIFKRAQIKTPKIKFFYWFVCLFAVKSWIITNYYNLFWGKIWKGKAQSLLSLSRSTVVNTKHSINDDNQHLFDFPNDKNEPSVTRWTANYDNIYILTTTRSTNVWFIGFRNKFYFPLHVVSYTQMSNENNAF